MPLCNQVLLTCHHLSTEFAFFVSTKKEVLSRHDSFDWFLDLRMTKIMPFLQWLSGVWVGNLNFPLTHNFNVLLGLAWPVSALSSWLYASPVSCVPVLCRHLHTPEHGSRNPSLGTEVGIMLYFLSAGPFPGWLDWYGCELALICLSDCIDESARISLSPEMNIAESRVWACHWILSVVFRHVIVVVY